jgi:hypothetical protein
MRLPILMSICVCIALVASAQPPSDEETIWKEFLGWLELQQPNSKPVELIGAYKTNLIHEGMPGAEVARRMGVISKFLFTRHKGVELL